MAVAVEQHPLERIYDDYYFFCETCLWVQDKQTLKIVPFRHKPAQVKVADLMLGEYRAGRPMRGICLKSRREGVSTTVQSIFYWLASTRSYQEGVTISHHKDTSKKLHGMSERFYRHTPKMFQPMKRKSRSGQILEFANPAQRETERAKNPGLESTLQVITFEDAGAGTAANLFHGSEVALWPGGKAKETLDTSLQIVPDAPGSIVILESTARGLGNEFHNRWQMAAAGESDYIPIFLAWFEEETNVRPDDEWTEFDGGPMERYGDEQAVMETFSLSREQMMWRRYAIDNLCGGSIDTLHQEYPATPDEAFLSTGRPYFDPHVVQAHLAHAKLGKWIARGEFHEYASKRVKGKTHISWYNIPRRGNVKIWADVEPDVEYILAADSSEGKEDSDYQCGYVIRRPPIGSEDLLELVACWHGRTDRDLFADELWKLGHHYNHALIAVEVTGGWGATPVAILKRRRYPNLYRRRPEMKKGVLGRKTDLLGFQTTPQTRPLILDALGQALRDEAIICNDADLLRECQTFIISDAGKPEAQVGYHDDRVITAALATHLALTEPRRAKAPQRHHERRVLSETTGY